MRHLLRLRQDGRGQGPPAAAADEAGRGVHGGQRGGREVQADGDAGDGLVQEDKIQAKEGLQGGEVQALKDSGELQRDLDCNKRNCVFFFFILRCGSCA